MGLKLTEICNRVATVEIHCKTEIYDEEPFVTVDIEAVFTDGSYTIDRYRYCTTDTKVVYEAVKRFMDKRFIYDYYFVTDYHAFDSNRHYSFDIHTVEKL